MAEEKYNPGHHAGATPAARMANQMKPSNVPGHAAMTEGSGPTRRVTTIHHTGNVKAHGGPLSPKGGMGNE